MRPIDGDTLTRDFESQQKIWFSRDEVLDLISDAPTVDAEPVRHEHWVRDTVDTPDIWFCTACRYCIAWRPSYCPNCGAKMDGGESE